MTLTAPDSLPRWNVTDLHPSVTSRSYLAAVEGLGADTSRLESLFDSYDIRHQQARPVTADDGHAADHVVTAYNSWESALSELSAYARSFVATNSRDDDAQRTAGELADLAARGRPLLARLAEWVATLGPDALAGVSHVAAEHEGPLRLLAGRAAHQMSEPEEGLYAALAGSGSTAWQRLYADVTSQLTAVVDAPAVGVAAMPMAAVRGLATHGDAAVRAAALRAELAAWPTVATTCAAALNAIKGEAVTVNRRRHWDSPLDASLFANNVSRRSFDAMGHAVQSVIPDLRRWMRCKAGLHGHTGPLPWQDLVAPLPGAGDAVSWQQGLDVVRSAFGSYGGGLADLPDRAVREGWIDAEPRDGKRGGAFCMPFFADRSLVFLNWSGSADSTQTTAHELGHAYHNTQLHHRTPLQRRLPMALAETASIFCETLVVEAGLSRLHGAERLAMLDVDLQGTNQVIVDIHSRFVFETELFARRATRTVSVHELNEMMAQAQAHAYGDGLDQASAHPYMWAVKPHYYNSHFYNWPYTYGLLFGLGLFASYRRDPEHFRSRYDDVLSRVGMEDAQQLGMAFGFDVTTEEFWMDSVEVVRARIADYERLAAHAPRTGATQ